MDKLTENKFKDLDKRFDKTDNKLDNILEKLGNFDARISKTETNIKWLKSIGTAVITFAVGTITFFMKDS